MRSRNPSSQFELTIDKVVYGGAGMGRHEGKVVFVPFAAPGDRVLVRAVEQKKSYMRAEIVRSIEDGPGKTVPGCPHFGRCGGCQWQHLEYDRQLEIKRGILEETIHHRFPESRHLKPRVLACPQPYEYRSRARLQLRGFGPESSVGFYRHDSHAVEDIQFCPLLQPVLNEGLKTVREARASGTSNPAAQQVELAGSQEDQKWGAVETTSDTEEDFSDLGKPELTPMGEPLLRRRAGSFQYLVSPAVFFQANALMIERLVSCVMNSVDSPAPEQALDLYAGVGLFTLPLAGRYKSVVAVECSPESHRLCEQNILAAGLDNARAVCSDANAWMRALHSVSSPGFDLVVLNPPRAGAGRTIMELLGEWVPETIIYVSCDPQTLCRDVAFLPARHYIIDFVEGLDLFPQTYHFETVMRLRRDK